MPIKPENRHKYPLNWVGIRSGILARAQGACECLGECGKHGGACARRNGDPIGESRLGRRVILTIGHLDHTPENCDPENLRAWCQRCHLAYDHPHHMANAAKTRARKAHEARLEAGEVPILPET